MTVRMFAELSSLMISLVSGFNRFSRIMKPSVCNKKRKVIKLSKILFELICYPDLETIAHALVLHVEFSAVCEAIEVQLGGDLRQLL